jgi:transcriptional regulator
MNDKERLNLLKNSLKIVDFVEKKGWNQTMVANLMDNLWALISDLEKKSEELLADVEKTLVNHSCR